MAETGSADARVMSQVPYFYLPMSAGVHDVWAGADLVLGRYARFIAATQEWPVDAILVANGLRRMSPLLGMLRLRFAVRVDGEDVRCGGPFRPGAAAIPIG